MWGERSHAPPAGQRVERTEDTSQAPVRRNTARRRQEPSDSCRDCTVRRRHGHEPEAAAAASARPGASRALPAYALLTMSIAMMVVYVGIDDLLVRLCAVSVVGFASLGSVLVAFRRMPACERRAWRWVVASMVIFLCGAVARQLLYDDPLLSLLPDTLSLVGYVAMAGALLVWLDGGKRRRTNDNLVDALLLGVGGLIVSWAFLVTPVLADGGHALAHRLLLSSFPVIDIVLLTLLVRLVLHRRERSAGFVLLVVSICSILVGDTSYSLWTIGVPVDIAWADAFYFMAYGAIATASLHPSRARLAAPAPLSSRRWGRSRLAGVSLAMLSPSVLLLVAPTPHLVDRVGRAVLAAALTGLVLYRTVGAINGFADSERRAQRQATHDDLTGLPNRLRLREHLSAELASPQAGALALLYLDLDGFKLINDSLGHGVGDELLVATAGRLRHHVRTDDFVARLGGDEFVVVTRRTALEEPRDLADRLLAAFEHPFALSTGQVYISPSIGIAHVDRTGPGDSDDPDAFDDADAAGALLRDADTAMYKAKASGRNRAAVFDASMREAVQARIEAETGLRQALENGDLRVHYQPIVHLRSGAVIGYEALLRWQHPTKGLVLPGAFIPVAEETWLMVPIGAYVLRQALAQVARWRSSERADVHVSVNVSARQLRDGDLVHVVEQALQENGLPGEALVLELTESALVEDPAAAAATLAALRRLGVRIAVDDFGTGYSALGYLKQFPVSIVKIDRQFVAGIYENPDDRALVHAIISMTEALGLAVVAEGVESVAQQQVLLDLGCELAQGWHYGHAEPAETVTRSLREERAPARA
jgi:diguanylate cyclase (GGDEF)-like protein